MHGLRSINRMNDWTDKQKAEYHKQLDEQAQATSDAEDTRLRFWAILAGVASVVIFAFTMI